MKIWPRASGGGGADELVQVDGALDFKIGLYKLVFISTEKMI